ncbi:hypothetical protein COV20_00800 [Candidatus Woesearchaeota archaeon CG10_big_fil_rev_8_21_14_0_10_45_16]|nr:MAG: hypothetical protein COV20_00800 [Candidatus Woesearchaeota archaeon CG10_big_fil_rev_8_21_14_0_10_45_16]
MKPVVKTYLLAGSLLFIALTLGSLVDNDSSITGFFVFEDLAPSGFEFIPPDDVSAAAASRSMELAEGVMEEMVQENMTMVLSADVMEEAHAAYDSGDYMESIRLAQFIDYIHKQKIVFLDKYSLLQTDIAAASSTGVDTSMAELRQGEAMASFTDDQLLEADELISQSRQELEMAMAENKRRQRISYLGKNFLLKYWWELLLMIVALIIAGVIFGKKWIVHRRRQKLRTLKLEQAEAQTLLKDLQKQCFVDKKISVQSYKLRKAHYEERLAAIKSAIPVLEEELAGKKIAKEKKILTMLVVKK